MALLNILLELYQQEYFQQRPPHHQSLNHPKRKTNQQQQQQQQQQNTHTHTHTPPSIHIPTCTLQEKFQEECEKRGRER